MTLALLKTPVSVLALKMCIMQILSVEEKTVSLQIIVSKESDHIQTACQTLHFQHFPRVHVI